MDIVVTKPAQIKSYVKLYPVQDQNQQAKYCSVDCPVCLAVATVGCRKQNGQLYKNSIHAERAAHFRKVAGRPKQLQFAQRKSYKHLSKRLRDKGPLSAESFYNEEYTKTCVTHGDYLQFAEVYSDYYSTFKSETLNALKLFPLNKEREEDEVFIDSFTKVYG